MPLIHHQKSSLKLRLYASAFLLVCPIVALTGCSHEKNVNFAPLTYDYLTPIFFNVSQITVNDQANNSQYPRDVSNLAPTSPTMALTNMANNRLKARGSSNHAVFIINRASLQESGHNGIYGQMDVTFEIYNNNNQKVASVQASVNHTYEANHSSGYATSKQNLYDVTQKMMQDMNVELEYQIRQHLGSWLVDATGNSLSGDIQSQNIGTPGSKTASTPQKSTAPATHTSSDDDDLSAVFPGGKPDSNQTTERGQNTINKTTNNKMPVGSLGTLPETATPNGY